MCKNFGSLTKFCSVVEKYFWKNVPFQGHFTKFVK